MEQIYLILGERNVNLFDRLNSGDTDQEDLPLSFFENVVQYSTAEKQTIVEILRLTGTHNYSFISEQTYNRIHNGKE